MPGLDLNYVPLNYLETYFVDKDTGAPLAGGLVYFYNDVNPTTLQPVFQLTGTPPDYSYIELPNPVILSATGCFQDASGNDIVPYARIYDEDGKFQLYHIEVYSNDGDGNPAVMQWTRDGIPNEGQRITPEGEDVVNYITNGQFKVHYDLPNNSAISAADTILAPGLWHFERSSGSTASDIITFPRFGQGLATPAGFPRYACRIQCTNVHAGDTAKKLIYSFRDVNKFASDVEEMNFSFSAQTNNASNLVVTIELLKFYGVGGDPLEVITLQQTLEIGSSYQTFNIPFKFGTNIGKNFGENDDDAVGIAISFPPTSIFDASFTNFALTDGNSPITYYPTTLEQDTYAGALLNWTQANPSKNYDAKTTTHFTLYTKYNIWLPLTMGQHGLMFNDADVGKIFNCMYETPRPGELECNGQVLDPDASDAYGCPYKRLWWKLYNYTYNLPMWGTGLSYFYLRQPDLLSTSNHLIVTNNTGLAATTPTDGTIATGFTFDKISDGSDVYAFNSSIGGDGTIHVSLTQPGAANGAPDNGTSPFLITEYPSEHPDIYTSYTIDASSNSGLAGEYFGISSHDTSYYVWFKEDGVGVDPAPGGTGIEVDLLSTYSSDEREQIIKDTLAGNTMYGITTIAASAMTAGAWFNWHSGTGQHICVWYEIGGVGTDPNISGARSVKVILEGSENAGDVAFATLLAVNGSNFAIPDLRGLYMRWRQNGSPHNFDPDVGTRTGWWRNFAGDRVGSYQPDAILAHKHLVYYISGAVGGSTGNTVNSPGSPGTVDSQTVGSSQTNVRNVYVMPVIKY
jgi:hypothetical protein